MSNERLVSQISSSADGSVECVSFRRSQTSALALRLPISEDYRKKTLYAQGLAQSRYTKLRLQDNFEKLKAAFSYEYDDSSSLNIKQNELVIYTRWVPGQTLRDLYQKEPPLKPEDTPRLKQKLRLWVRIFEHLARYHQYGIFHGNLKPENILVRDSLPAELALSNESEFLDKKMEIPSVIFLDGGYQHILEYPQADAHSSRDMDKFAPRLSTEKKNWLAPEARGFLEGSYGMASDIFSLAAVMAWDFGFLKTHRHNILHELWMLFHNMDGHQTYFCQGLYTAQPRSNGMDMVKRLRTLLQKALDPVVEKRADQAKELAQELLVISNRLADALETPEGALHMAPDSDKYSIDTLSAEHKKEILLKKFDIPDKIATFVLEEETLTTTRLWIEARNKTANKHALMRSVQCGLGVLQIPVLYFGVKTAPYQVPFYNLDLFCQELISYIVFINQDFPSEIYGILNDMDHMIDSIFFVLPCLKKYYQKNPQIKKKNKNQFIQSHQESIQKNIENLVIKFIHYSKIHFIILDDINRSDHSSISIILKILTNQKIKTKWIIGIRSEESLVSEITQKNILQIKQKDIIYSSLKESRTVSYWIQKLNMIEKNFAKVLASLSISPNEITIENIEIISNKFLNNKEKIIELKEDVTFNNQLEDEDWILSDPQYESDRNLSLDTGKSHKDPMLFAYDSIQKAISLGLINEKRDLSSGCLISYTWEHQFVLQFFYMLLRTDIKNQIHAILCDNYQENFKKDPSLSKIIFIIDCLIFSKQENYHQKSYEFISIASKEIFDIYSSEYIIKKLQLLEEKIESERPKNSIHLIPKIREKIADLARSINKKDLALKYYEAVSWNVMNLKKRSILMIKSFFPSQYQNREQRTKEFYKVTSFAQRAKLIPANKNTKSSNHLNEIKNFLHKIQKSSKESIFYPENKILNYFVRSCIGWIDNSDVYQYIFQIMPLYVERLDLENTVHILFSLLLTCERNLPAVLRLEILELIVELASKMESPFTIYEVRLMRAWCALFYDGNLGECKKNIDRLKGSQTELPLAIRQCLRKLELICEFEMLPVDDILQYKNNLPIYQKKFQDSELISWDVGESTFHLKHQTPHLKPQTGDGLFIGNILSEKIDHILLYSYFLLEADYANAAVLVCQEARQANQREWFADDSSHIAYAPERFAFPEHVSALKKEDTNPLPYWGHDQTVRYQIKLDVLKTQDTEKLYTLAKLMMQAGFLWGAYRLTCKGHLSFENLYKEQLGTRPTPTASQSPAAEAPAAPVLVPAPVTSGPGTPAYPQPVYERERAYPEQGVAINYVLEFLHNFQHQIGSAAIDEQTLKTIVSSIQSAIPKDTDLVESTLAGAIRASAKRLQDTPVDKPKL